MAGKYLSAEGRAVWQKIRTRYEAGDRKVTVGIRRMAEEALGETFVRPGRGQRPDVQDRAAADHSFDRINEGMVVL